MKTPKEEVRDFWDAEPCGSVHADGAERYSRAYFDRIEDYRYGVEPEIFSFAQFTRFHGQKVLEAGVGAGTDFLQWVRAGAEAWGVDLTPEGVDHVRRRLKVYGLSAADLREADIESLPHPDDFFDLVYSWGVIHHTPDTEKALSELVRVARPGGRIKFMVYNRRSLGAFYMWVENALFRLRPWKSIAWCLANFQESPGTKGYTAAELSRILARHPVEGVRVGSLPTYVDDMRYSKSRLRRMAGRILAAVFPGERFGWFLTAECVKTGPAGRDQERRA